MKRRTREFLVIFCLILSAGTLWGLNPGPPNFPLIGIALGQTLRLNAVAANPGPPITPGAPTAAACSATISFVDSAGNAVAMQPGPPTINLTPGQAAFVDLRAVQLGLRFGARAQVRPVIAFPAGDVGTGCLFTAEVFDAFSGFSQVMIGSGPPILPGSLVTYSLMGVAFGQTLRLNAVAIQPGPPLTPAGGVPTAAAGPCVVTLGFVDSGGNSVQVKPGPPLSPGQAAFVDLPAVQLVTRFGQRALVRPVVTVDSVPGADACAGVVTAAETFDTLTGRTGVETKPGPPQ